MRSQPESIAFLALKIGLVVAYLSWLAYYENFMSSTSSVSSTETRTTARTPDPPRPPSPENWWPSSFSSQSRLFFRLFQSIMVCYTL